MVAWFTRIAQAYGPPVITSHDLSIDWRVAAAMFAVVIFTGIAAGLAPALALARTDIRDELAQGGGSSGDRGGRQWLRRGLVIGEVALTLTLVVSAGTLLRSFQSLQAETPGFDAEGLYALRLSVSQDRYRSPAAAQGFARQLLERIRALPNVENAAMVWRLPLWDPPRITAIEVAGQEPPSSDEPAFRAAVNLVSPDYFQTAQVRLTGGRLFSGTERHGSPGVVIVNETLASQVWPADDRLGNRLRFPGETEWREVIGVVADVRNQSMMSPAKGEIYLPAAQYADTGPATLAALRHSSYVIRTRGAGEGIPKAVRQEVSRIDPDLAVWAIEPVGRIVQAGSEELLMGVFLHVPLIALGLVLSGAGIHGILTYTVARRAREIGIRIAPGANRRELLRMVVRQALRLAAVGIVAGAAITLLVVRLLASLIPTMQWAGPMVFASATATLFFAAAAAAYIPARHATRVDPVAVLRCS